MYRVGQNGTILKQFIIPLCDDTEKRSIHQSVQYFIWKKIITLDVTMFKSSLYIVREIILHYRVAQNKPDYSNFQPN